MDRTKGFSAIIAVILILAAVAIIGGGAYWVMTQQAATNQNTNINTANVNTTVNQNLNASANQNANENTNAASNQNINSTVNQNTNNSINQNANTSTNTNSDPTADWKMYRNEKYGFGVKYPSGWDYREYGKQVFFDVIGSLTNTTPESEPSITKATITIDDPKEWDEWINKLKNTLKFEDYKESTFVVSNNISVRKISGKVTGESYIKGKYYIGVLFNNGQNSYLFAYTHETLEFLSIFDLIIKSLNFYK